MCGRCEALTLTLTRGRETGSGLVGIEPFPMTKLPCHGCMRYRQHFLAVAIIVGYEIHPVSSLRRWRLNTWTRKVSVSGVGFASSSRLTLIERERESRQLCSHRPWTIPTSLKPRSSVHNKMRITTGQAAQERTTCNPSLQATLLLHTYAHAQETGEESNTCAQGIRQISGLSSRLEVTRRPRF